MDARQLEIFVAVAEERSFTRAARRLFAAQSTVSAAVRALEAELGAPLFERSTRSVEPTTLGESTLADALEALEAIDRIRTAAAPESGGLRGRVRLGIFSSLEFLDLPGLIGRFHRDNPLVNLRLVVSPTGSSGLLDDVRHGRLDVALVGMPRSELQGLESVEIGETGFVAVLPDGHPLAARKTVTLAALADERFVDTPPGFGNRVAVDRAFEALGRPRAVIADVPELPAVPRYVAAGLGIAVVPTVTPVDVRGVITVPLRDGPRWVLSVIASARRGAAANALLEVLATRRGTLQPQTTLR